MPGSLPVLVAAGSPVLLAGLRALLAAHSEIHVAGACSTFAGTLRELRRHRPRVLLAESTLCSPDTEGNLTLVRQASAETRVALICHEPVLPDGYRWWGISPIGAVLPIDVAEDALVACIRALGYGGCWPPTEDCPGRVRGSGAPGRRSPLALLSVRERQVAQLVAFGKKNREIAEACGITPGTVKLHLHRIYGKLGVNNRLALFRKLVQEAQK